MSEKPISIAFGFDDVNLVDYGYYFEVKGTSIRFRAEPKEVRAFTLYHEQKRNREKEKEVA